MLEKKYNHKQVEEGKYKKWLESKYFESGDKAKKPYCIVLPTPNITIKPSPTINRMAAMSTIIPLLFFIFNFPSFSFYNQQ